jgi:membrane protease YdiL (CAAX protease family)
MGASGIRCEVVGGDRSTTAAVAIVSLAWSMQHPFMPWTFDLTFMAFQMVSPVPFSVFATLAYLRLRRLLPLAIARALMDGASVLIPALLPLIRG